MKRVIFTIAMVLTTYFVMAQSVPNNSFESWSNSQPDFWTTTLSGNVMTELFGTEVPVPVSLSFGSSTTDAHSGNLALKIAPVNFGIPGTEYNYLLPGIAQLGSAEPFSIPMSVIVSIASGDIENLDITSLASMLNLIAKGVPCNMTPHSVKMWVKFLPAGSDTLSVMAMTKSGGVPVSYAMFITENTINEYTEVEAVFDNPNSSCDSLCIMILAGDLSTNSATVLYVDDVTLDFGNGVVEHIGGDMALYPNPATSAVTLSVPGEAFSYEMTDLAGRMVRSGDGNQYATVDVSSLPAGVYMIRMKCDSQVVTRKLIVK